MREDTARAAVTLSNHHNLYVLDKSCYTFRAFDCSPTPASIPGKALSAACFTAEVAALK